MGAMWHGVRTTTTLLLCSVSLADPVVLVSHVDDDVLEACLLSCRLQLPPTAVAPSSVEGGYRLALQLDDVVRAGAWGDAVVLLVTHLGPTGAARALPVASVDAVRDLAAGAASRADVGSATHAAALELLLRTATLGALLGAPSAGLTARR